MRQRFLAVSHCLLLASHAVMAQETARARLPTLGLCSGQSPEPVQRTVSINGIDLSFQVRGTGSGIVLLHGFLWTKEYWTPIVDSLAKKHCVIAVDLRGHGRSTNPTGEFTHRQVASDVLGLLDSLGLKRVDAMGQSSGGMTLLHLALQAPERVRAMVLMDATPRWTEEAVAEFKRWPEIPPARIADQFRPMHPGGESQLRALSKAFRAFADRQDDMNITDQQLGQISARVLLIHGDRDSMFPLETPVGMYRALPHASLWIVPNKAHFTDLRGPLGSEIASAALSLFGSAADTSQAPPA